MRFSHWREVEGPNCLSPFSGNERFRELQSLLPDVTQRMLTMQLHELEADGVIERRVCPEVSAQSGILVIRSGQNSGAGDRRDVGLGHSVLQGMPPRRQREEVDHTSRC